MDQIISQRTGGELLVDCLKAQGVTHAFGVPGESYLAVLDAFFDAEIDFVVCRQEGGAAMMAEATGKLTGRPGICFVTRGPGATNATPGVHIARQDSTPMILFMGQVARNMRGREAFQEVNVEELFSGMAKWAAEIPSAESVPEYVARAFSIAMAGRPGPVVLALPEDMLTDSVANPVVPPRIDPVPLHPTQDQLAEFETRLLRAKKPIFIVGGSRWSPESMADLKAFAERWDVPVACSFRRQMLFDANHRCYVGDLGFGVNPALRKRVEEADLVVLLGTRFSEAASQSYELLEVPTPRQALIHIHPGAEEIGRVYAPDLGIVASPGEMVRALEKVPVPDNPSWSGWREDARQDCLEWSEPGVREGTAGVDMNDVIRILRDRLPSDAIICNGAGNYAIWVHRFLRFSHYGTQLAPTSGSMGYGTPAAVAAQYLHPAKKVIAFAGDGCFLMNGQELATAVQYKLPILIIVVNNGMYGTIRMHQEREYPARVSATFLKNPHFAELAKAYGAQGYLVTENADFEGILEKALKASGPALIELRTDPNAITPSATLSGLRKTAMAKA